MSINYRNLFLTIYFLIAGMFVVLAVTGGMLNYTPVPFYDMWGSMQISLEDLWRQHNEHRIVLSRLIFWADNKLAGANLWFAVLANYILLASLTALLIMILKERLDAKDKYPFLVLSALITIIMFSWIQKENMVSPFQNQFFLALLMPLLAFYMLHKSKFWLAALLGVLSYGTMANGVLVPPLLIVMAVLLREKPSKILLLSVLCVLGTAFYFHGYQSVAGNSEHSSVFASIFNHPIGVFRQTVAYLAAPVSRVAGKSEVVRILAALFLLASVAYFGLKSLKAEKKDTLALAIIMMLFFIIGTATITMAGRFAPDLPIYVPRRYYTPAVLAWCLIIVLYANAFARLFTRHMLKASAALLLIPIMLFRYQLGTLSDQTEKYLDRQLTALALEMEVEDTEQLLSVFPNADHLKYLANGLKYSNGGFFTGPAIYQTSTFIYEDSKSFNFKVCSSEPWSYELIDDEQYVRISGKIHDAMNRKKVDRAFLVNSQSGEIAGAVVYLDNQYSGYLLKSAERESLLMVGQNCHEQNG